MAWRSRRRASQGPGTRTAVSTSHSIFQQRDHSRAELCFRLCILTGSWFPLDILFITTEKARDHWKRGNEMVSVLWRTKIWSLRMSRPLTHWVEDHTTISIHRFRRRSREPLWGRDEETEEPECKWEWRVWAWGGCGCVCYSVAVRYTVTIEIGFVFLTLE
jgi:hypothetical protein